MLMQLEIPSVDKQRDICLWEDSNRQVVAIAGLIIPEIGADIVGILGVGEKRYDIMSG
ncbi:MAG: hypothetical protein F6K48_04790 [Okeania sp. SIO3H1]|nr:hypothetical protein [Okeania sp. SIO3H1]